jgi:transposase InsO family protein
VPWKAISPVDERARFVMRAQDGESITDLCREFGISRKTGHKILKRFREGSYAALEDQGRAPKRIPHRTPPEIRALILSAKRRHASWGPKKLKAWLERKNEGLELPAPSTIGELLRREGLVNARGPRRRATALSRSELTRASAPNEVWCADFKGQFRLGNGQYCYPLTITDLHSRYLIACTALEGTKSGPALWAFEEAFQEYGLPAVIRTDNGVPFASTGLAGLSSLSAYWMRLGVRPERTEPASPQQNGEHERMHRTLKAETTRPAGANLLQQQERFDRFREEFNEERPHEAIGQRPPAELYIPSDRRLSEELPELMYPLHDVTRLVSVVGHVYLNGGYFHLTQALAGHDVGLRELEDGRWLVSYTSLDLGYYDPRTGRFEKRADA